MTTFDLEHTYLGIDGEGGVKSWPGGEAFWTMLDQTAAGDGTLVTVSVMTEDWAHWEMHPHGDEVLIGLEGTSEVIFQTPQGDSLHTLAAGSTLIVPAGVWHRGRHAEPARILFITYGRDTQHKPLRV